MYKKYLSIFLLILCVTVSYSTFAGDLQSTKMMSSFLKQNDGTKRIKVTLLAVEEKGKSPVENASIKFSVQDGDNPVQLGSSVTNYKGEAFFILPKTARLPKDKDGVYNFSIQFEGDSKLSPSKSSISVKDVQIELIVNEQDTSKSIKALVYEMDDNGVKKMLKDVDVEFDVKRLFCNYGFANVKTDSSGGCTAVFPARMPGDSSGTLTILARLVDNENYGNVETSQKVKWGVPVLPTLHKKRGLGDTDAPLWMVYTLIVLLSGVWLHFSYIIYCVLRINYLGKKLLRESGQL